MQTLNIILRVEFLQLGIMIIITVRIKEVLITIVHYDSSEILIYTFYF